MRFYLNCPYEEKDEAKALGAMWDKFHKRWYYEAEEKNLAFAKWEETSYKFRETKESKEALKIYLNVPYTKRNDAKAMGVRWDADSKQWYCTENDKMALAKWSMVENRSNVELLTEAIFLKKASLKNAHFSGFNNNARWTLNGEGKLTIKREKFPYADKEFKEVLLWHTMRNAVKSIEITNANYLKMKNNIFSEYSNLEAIVIKGRINEIGCRAFADCISLKTMDLSGLTVKRIGSSMLEHDSELVKISIPNFSESTVIFSSSFTGCHKSIREAFESCANVTIIHDTNNDRSNFLKDISEKINSIVQFKNGRDSLCFLVNDNILAFNDDVIEITPIDFHDKTQDMTLDSEIILPLHNIGIEKVKTLYIHAGIRFVDSRSFKDFVSLENVFIMGKDTDLMHGDFQRLKTSVFESCPNLTNVYCFKGSKAEKYIKGHYPHVNIFPIRDKIREEQEK